MRSSEQRRDDRENDASAHDDAGDDEANEVYAANLLYPDLVIRMSLERVERVRANSPENAADHERNEPAGTDGRIAEHGKRCHYENDADDDVDDCVPFLTFGFHVAVPPCFDGYSIARKRDCVSQESCSGTRM